MKTNLFLIGYRGTGKTTVGRLLAERFGRDFVDADVHLEDRFQTTIKQMFAQVGEPVFRERESAILSELAARGGLVIGTGGGVILREENRALLRDTGVCIWLTADVATIAHRLAEDPTTSERRPDLTTGGLAEIVQLLEKREPLYRECADLEIDTRGRSPEAIVEAILSQWHSTGSNFSGSPLSFASGPRSEVS